MSNQLQDLKANLEKASIAKSKKEMIQALRLARSFAGSLDHLCYEEIEIQLQSLESYKGRLSKDLLEKIQMIYKSLL